MSIQTLSVALSTAYIFSWSVGGESDERDRAVVFSDDEIVLRATEDKKLGVAVTKAMLNDSSSIRATERNIEVR